MPLIATPLIATPQRRFALESGLLFLAASVVIGLAIGQQWLSRLDNTLYDLFINQHQAQMVPEVVIVAIDDETLHNYGPWPWPRSLQAQLVSRIQAHQPNQLVLDIVYAGETADDQILAQAMAGVSELALPMMIDRLNHAGMLIEVLPNAELFQHADASGHVQVELDDDAIVRGTYLFQGVGTPHWPHIMAALKHTPRPADCTGEPEGLALQQCDYVRVPFAGPAGTYPRISALDILTRSPSELAFALRDKIVLVGLTGLGAGDWITSPNSATNGPMPGVEFNANLYSALQYEALIRPAPLWTSLLLAILITAACAYLLPRLAAKPMVFATIALALIPCLLGYLSLAMFQHYLATAASSIGVLLIYPLWSWRRHEIAWSYIAQELQRIELENQAWQQQSVLGTPDAGALANSISAMLQGQLSVAEDGSITFDRDKPLNPQESQLLSDWTERAQQHTPINEHIPGERLAAQIGLLEVRAREVREGRAVGLAGLGRMANGVVIFSAFGEIRFANHAAAETLQLNRNFAHSCYTLLDAITPPLGMTWPEIVHNVIFSRRPISFEALVKETPLFVAAEPLDTGADYADHWVLTFADLSAIRQAQAQREEALAFLSHDIRSPLLSVLALIRNQGDNSELLQNIAQYTQKGLSTSDQFLQLSRLQLQGDFETYELAVDQLLENACEQMFFLAKDKHITIQNTLPAPQGPESVAEDEDGVWINANGELLERALVNLLGNAIKYSEANTQINTRLTTTEQNIFIEVEDQGHGIPEAELAHIFDPYFRSQAQELAENRGAGLGLRFVKTVVERHKGDIKVKSTRGVGTTFTIRLPRS